jgi:hypothetical protein
MYYKEKFEMEKRLHGKKLEVITLIALILICLAEVIFRAVALGEAALGISNAGEQITTIIFAAIILIFTAKKNDRISYVCCGALVAYFVMDQLFELPGTIGDLLVDVSNTLGALSIAVRLLAMIGIVAMCVVLVEFVNDGSIYKRAYNVITFITLLLHVVGIVLAVIALVSLNGATVADGTNITLYQNHLSLVIFNNVNRIAMVILLAIFAYDSATRQLKRGSITQ